MQNYACKLDVLIVCSVQNTEFGYSQCTTPTKSGADTCYDFKTF